MTQTKHSLEMINSTAKATFLMSLSPDDFDKVKRSGPLVLNFGGDFSSGGDTISVAANEQTITTYQYTVSVTFNETGKDAAYNEQAAKDWMLSIDTKLTTELGTARTDDAALTGGLPIYVTI